MFRTNNPALKNDAFAPAQTWDSAMQSMGSLAPDAVRERSTTMTLQGTIWKSFLLLAICVVVAAVGWNLILADRALLFPISIGGCAVGFVLGLIMCFKPKTSPFLAPIFAVAEGCVLASASVFWSWYASGAGKLSTLGTGLVMQAGLLTFGVAACMLIAYGTKLIKPTRWMLAGVAAATGGVLFFSLVMVLLSFFAPGAVMGFWESPLGLAVAGLIVVIAAFNLVSDFALVQNGVENKAPKYMEWYAGYALLVTIVWLYVSILRLLALLRRQ